jgi:hypothetical protein
MKSKAGAGGGNLNKKPCVVDYREAAIGILAFILLPFTLYAAHHSPHPP